MSKHKSGSPDWRDVYACKPDAVEQPGYWRIVVQLHADGHRFVVFAEVGMPVFPDGFRAWKRWGEVVRGYGAEAVASAAYRCAFNAALDLAEYDGPTLTKRMIWDLSARA